MAASFGLVNSIVTGFPVTTLTVSGFLASFGFAASLPVNKRKYLKF